MQLKLFDITGGGGTGTHPDGTGWEQVLLLGEEQVLLLGEEQVLLLGEEQVLLLGRTVVSFSWG
jgi:hypothetical protein